MNDDERNYLKELSKGKDADVNKLEHYANAIRHRMLDINDKTELRRLSELLEG